MKLRKLAINNAPCRHFWVGNSKDFETNTLQSPVIAKYSEKKKSLNFGPKMPGLGSFGMAFGNNIIF